MEKETIKKKAHDWVTNNPDPEVRRMYGHYLRAFIAGAESVTSEPEANPEKQEQRKLLKEIMDTDQEHGMYEANPEGENKLEKKHPNAWLPCGEFNGCLDPFSEALQNAHDVYIDDVTDYKEQIQALETDKAFIKNLHRLAEEQIESLQEEVRDYEQAIIDNAQTYQRKELKLEQEIKTLRQQLEYYADKNQNQ